MESKSFQRIYLPLSGKLYRIAFYMLESKEEAEDALQELYLRLWKNRAGLDEIALPEAYCTRLLKNICIDRIRAAKPLVAADGLQVADTDQTQEEAIDSRQRLEKVLAAVKSLPDRQRQVLKLRLIEGKSYKEIAEITKLDNLTLRVVLARARKALKLRI